MGGWPSGRRPCTRAMLSAQARQRSRSSACMWRLTSWGLGSVGSPGRGRSWARSTPPLSNKTCTRCCCTSRKHMSRSCFVQRLAAGKARPSRQSVSSRPWRRIEQCHLGRGREKTLESIRSSPKIRLWQAVSLHSIRCLLIKVQHSEDLSPPAGARFQSGQSSFID
jgi:hypothetical protein